MNNIDGLSVYGYEKLISSLKGSVIYAMDSDLEYLNSMIDKYSKIVDDFKCDHNNTIVPTEKESTLVRTNLYRILCCRYANGPSFGYREYPDEEHYKNQSEYDKAVKAYNNKCMHKERFLSDLRGKIYETEMMDLISYRILVMKKINKRMDVEIKLYNSSNMDTWTRPKHRTHLEQAAIDNINILLIERFENKNMNWIKTNRNLKKFINT